MIWNTARLRGFFGAYVLLTGLLVSGCDSSETGVAEQAESMSQIEGSVIYRERMMLPPGSELEIQLQDVSRADAPASVLATVMMTPEGGPPYPFSIEYNPAQIDDRMQYALRATIRLDGRLLFTNTDYINAFGGNPVEVLVRRVPESVKSVSEPVLVGTNWQLVTLSGEPAATGAGDRPADLQLSEQEQRAAGFSGCNRFSGSYSSEGDATHGTPLSFGPLAGTMMACAEGGDLERTYLQMLAGVSAYRLESGVLSLLHGDQVVATFSAE
ncbi:MAG: YbaY family lipoprotein [Halieaceae bacterium]